MHHRIFFTFLSASLFLALCMGLNHVTAQDSGVEVSDATCEPILNALWASASDACVSGPAGYICNGGNAAPIVEPGGPVSNALASVGALVDATEVQSLQTRPINAVTSLGGVAWLRLPDPLYITAILVGDVNIDNSTPPNYPAWQSIQVQTGVNNPTCGLAPRNALVLQTPLNYTSSIVINGTSLIFDGTVMIQTTPDQTQFINLSGEARLIARGQEQSLLTGQQNSVSYASGDFSIPASGPTVAQPLQVSLVEHFPVALLDRPVLLPQPGYVATTGQVNMRNAPSTEGLILGQVAAGQILAVLGQNPAGDWLHVRLESGETGWMFAELLQHNVGEINAVYEATPAPPQRYGSHGQFGRVISPTGTNIRTAPYVTFPAIITLGNGATLELVARSPYSPWVKIKHGEVTGWAALATIETHSIIDALPLDFDIPLPPEPTPVPGMFGNAFPDPRGGN
jgi:uncharacterized protein YraI